MTESQLKFSGAFTILDTEKDEKFDVAVQVLYAEDHHIIVIYDFNEDKMKLAYPVITGVIKEFELDQNTTAAMGCSCPLISSGESEPEDNISWGIVFHWVNGEATILDVQRFDKEEA
jgi:hypothetical protein